MSTKQLLSVVVAIIVGEIVLAVLTTIAQEVLFNGIRFHSSSWPVIIFGGLATFLAAIGAGRIARWVVKADRKIVPIGISLLIVTETTYLIIQEVSGDPLWFDVLAGLSLVAGIWLGFYRLQTSPQPQLKT